MDQKIFQELSLSQGLDGPENEPQSLEMKQKRKVQYNAKFSLSEIVTRNKIAKSLDLSNSGAQATASRFSVRKTNKYANKRNHTIEVKVLDLIYQSKACTLIHMRDITKVLEMAGTPDYHSRRPQQQAIDPNQSICGLFQSTSVKGETNYLLN